MENLIRLIFFPESFNTNMINNLNKVKEDGVVLRMEDLASDRYGNDAWFDYTIIPFSSDLGKIEYIMVVSDNTTDRKKWRKQLRHLEKMDAIGHLAGGVAHDFNNQLTGVLGYADLLSNSLDDPVLKKYAENISTSAKRSSELTNMLLAFSRKSISRSEFVDIHQLINETSEMLLRSIDKRIIIHQDLNARSCTVSGDSSQLQNALLNLGINSRDAMSDGGSLRFETEVISVDNHEKNLPNNFLKTDPTSE